jgi:Bacterial transcriptional activator domain
LDLGAKVAGSKMPCGLVIAAEHLRESGYRLLMVVHELAGSPAEGLIVFDELRTRLRNQIGSAPTQLARTLHRRLLGDA